jgi:hypothetical protein
MVSLTMFMSIHHLLKLVMLILLSLAVSSSLPSYFSPSFLPNLPWSCENVVLLTPGLLLLFLLDRNQEHVSRLTKIMRTIIFMIMMQSGMVMERENEGRGGRRGDHAGDKQGVAGEPAACLCGATFPHTSQG